MKLCYIDVETTGLDPKINSIWQLAGIIEIDEEIKEEFNFVIRPDPNKQISLAANIPLTKVLKAEFSQFEVYTKFIYILDNYINKFDSEDKFYFVGYNSHTFDTQFIRQFFLDHDNKFYGSYFYNPSIDVMLVSAFAALGQRNKLPDFKLLTVASSLGLKTDEDKAHDALYDVKLTRDIFLMLKEEFL